jgi:hypothetical protein
MKIFEDHSLLTTGTISGSSSSANILLSFGFVVVVVVARAIPFLFRLCPC